jgi:hypothetical protein
VPHGWVRGSRAQCHNLAQNRLNALHEESSCQNEGCTDMEPTSVETTLEFPGRHVTDLSSGILSAL